MFIVYIKYGYVILWLIVLYLEDPPMNPNWLVSTTLTLLFFRITPLTVYESDLYVAMWAWGI